MLAAAWAATLAAVIENCFRHASFGHHASAALPAPEVSESGGDLQEAWDALRSAGDSVPSIVELEDFLCAEADVVMPSVRQEHDNDSENGDHGKRASQPTRCA